MNRRSHLLAFVILALASHTATARAGDFEDEVQASFGPVVKEYDIPGLVVGVTRSGKHAFYATGLASRSDNRPVSPDTLFELGSISKIFNVTLAALAEQRGKLTLDDTVAHHVCADACSIGNDLTLMDLATHYSGGLPLQVPDGVSDADGLVTWLKNWHPPQPGTRSYSNVSIGMLGYISGKALGTNYKRASQDVLFPAFGLHHTWIDVPKSEMSQYAFGYDRKTNAPIRVNPGVLDAEAYGVKSSVRDMLKVLDVELGHGNASQELRGAVERTHEGQYKTAFFTQAMIWEQYPWPTDLQTMLSGNGYDFIMKPQPAEKISLPLHPQKDAILNKTGSTNGFGGYVAMVPSEEIGVVVLANKNYPNEARVKATYSLIKALLAK
ncbi:beta-lactamase class C [Mycoplana sp. BE70]|uniref:class C beta-lactamase n=1 Tax=Mycoplana sp. BE70 TaxID=2817775 RepID=UPI00285FDE33|nr:class C beta-lactamase [Mycoplana sp. BE70]MDR6759725.1 beta-lactamase class C [Mycoplana sp. BE70]